jgi:hypothetical protein
MLQEALTVFFFVVKERKSEKVLRHYSWDFTKGMNAAKAARISAKEKNGSFAAKGEVAKNIVKPRK